MSTFNIGDTVRIKRLDGSVSDCYIIKGFYKDGLNDKHVANLQKENSKATKNVLTTSLKLAQPFDYKA